MNPVPYHRLVPLGGVGSVDLRTVAFGEKLPASPGVYILLASPRSVSEMERGFGTILFVGASDNLDETIGRNHGAHPRFWAFIAASAAEVGYITENDATERSRICEALKTAYQRG